ncbi:MAG: glycosyl transferase, partial [Methyloligellaceae bacterium]
PRLAGTSKYSNLGRALIGLYDLFGVSWLRKRTAVPPVAEDSAAAERISDFAGTPEQAAPRPARNRRN